MRAFLASVIIVVLGGCSPAPTEERVELTARKPPFEFRGLRIGTSLTQAKRAKIVEGCLDVGDYMMCRLAKREVGQVPIWESYVDFAHGTFDGLMIDVNADWFESVQADLRSAYGEPCSSESKNLQNAYGATFSGDEVVWCFADGALTLARHNKDDVRKSGMVFRVLKPVAPRKTFSARTL